MASIPPEEPGPDMPDTGPIESPEPTPMPTELPAVGPDYDQPSPMQA